MIESKSQLAKLLATEDITVRNSHEAKTASFDVKARWPLGENCYEF